MAAMTSPREKGAAWEKGSEWSFSMGDTNASGLLDEKSTLTPFPWTPFPCSLRIADGNNSYHHRPCGSGLGRDAPGPPIATDATPPCCRILRAGEGA